MTGERFNILSLSGGGYLGLYTVAILAGIEKETGRPIADCVDLLAGTSVGGIIALGLAAGIPASEIQEAFEKDGTAIFSARPAPTSKIGGMLDVARALFGPKYSSAGLRKTVCKLVGANKLIGQLERRVIVPAVNLTKGAPQLFKTPHHPDFKRDLHRKVVDVALATSAAPTYFPIAEIGDELFADGGLYANSPDLLALHEADHFLKKPIEQIHLLSVGTTTAQFSFAHADGRELGIWGWSREQRLVSVIIASQQKLTDYMVGHRLGPRYLRLDADQSRKQEQHLALDVATEAAQKTIRGLAASTVQANLNTAALSDYLSHHAPAPTFHRMD